LDPKGLENFKKKVLTSGTPYQENDERHKMK